MDELSISATHVTVRPFRVGGVLGDALYVLMKRPSFLGISAVANLPLLWAHYQLGVNLGSTGFKDVILAGLLMALWGGAYEAMVAASTLRQLRGNVQGSLIKSARRAVRLFAPVTATSLLTEVIVCAGLVLLFVPGVIASTALIVTVSACMVEGINPWESVSRSIALTKGRKAEIFGALLVPGTFHAAASAALRLLAPRVGPATLVAGFYIWNILSWAYGAVLAAVIYRDLRAEKEGVDIEQIASALD